MDTATDVAEKAQDIPTANPKTANAAGHSKRKSSKSTAKTAKKAVAKKTAKKAAAKPKAAKTVKVKAKKPSTNGDKPIYRLSKTLPAHYVGVPVKCAITGEMVTEAIVTKNGKNVSLLAADDIRKALRRRRNFVFLTAFRTAKGDERAKTKAGNAAVAADKKAHGIE